MRIIYRDLKPENVLVCADGKIELCGVRLDYDSGLLLLRVGNVKLCDFGLAAIGLTAPATQPSASGRPVLIGTTEYMAPEIIRMLECGQAFEHRPSERIRDHLDPPRSPRGPERTRDGPRSSEMARDSPSWPEMARDHPRSPEIVRAGGRPVGAGRVAVRDGDGRGALSHDVPRGGSQLFLTARGVSFW